MTQELSTPLTSILGMASVLMQGIYGTLSEKQKEYLEIIHNSGQYLQSLVNEIVDIGVLDDSGPSLNLSQVDIEMLCQQAIMALNQMAHRRDQQIQLTIEPGNRIWLLDKDKVRQMLYHLVFCVVQSSSADSVIRIHVSRRQSFLSLTVWTSHPWLGESLPQAGLAVFHYFGGVGSANSLQEVRSLQEARSQLRLSHSYEAASDWDSDWETETVLERNLFESKSAAVQKTADLCKLDSSRQSLGLIFSRQLAEMQGGSISIRGSAGEGYRYVIQIPQIQNHKEEIRK